MDMSRAALPPINAPITESDRKHPRFAEYMRYRSGMIQLMVNCMSFESWLRQTEDMEQPLTAIFQVKPWKVPECDRPEGWLAPGWYVHVFGPQRKLLKRLGPFNTKTEAECSGWDQ